MTITAIVSTLLSYVFTGSALWALGIAASSWAGAFGMLLLSGRKDPYQFEGPAHVGLALGVYHLKIGPVTVAIEKEACTTCMFSESRWTVQMLSRAAREINLHVRHGRGIIPNIQHRAEDVVSGYMFVKDIACIPLEIGGSTIMVPMWEMFASLSRSGRLPDHLDGHLTNNHFVVLREYCGTHHDEIQELIENAGEEPA
jgi:hypothetical protein